MDEQFSGIHSNPDIIIATPGRLLHLVVEMEMSLTTVEYVVFDEADQYVARPPSCHRVHSVPPALDRRDTRI
jgi:superfamily II DNA/RNA helicase